MLLRQTQVRSQVELPSLKALFALFCKSFILSGVSFCELNTVLLYSGKPEPCSKPSIFNISSAVSSRSSPSTNPPSKMPLFISLTQGMSEERRRQQANWAGIYAAAIMLVSLVCGNVLLAFFGISYGAMRIAGGLVVAAIGYQMLFGGNSPNKAPIVRRDREDYAFSPLPCRVSRVPVRSLWSSDFLQKLQSSRAISIWLSLLHGRR